MKRRLYAALILVWMAGLLTGCADVVHWHSRTLFGVDCRPEKLQDGQCVAAR
jgi:hypothetical protein